MTIVNLIVILRTILINKPIGHLSTVRGYPYCKDPQRKTNRKTSRKK